MVGNLYVGDIEPHLSRGRFSPAFLILKAFFGNFFFDPEALLYCLLQFFFCKWFCDKGADPCFGSLYCLSFFTLGRGHDKWYFTAFFIRSDPYQQFISSPVGHVPVADNEFDPVFLPELLNSDVSVVSFNDIIESEFL